MTIFSQFNETLAIDTFIVTIPTNIVCRLYKESSTNHATVMINVGEESRDRVGKEFEGNLPP